MILQLCGVTICVCLQKICSWLWPRMSGWPFTPDHRGFYKNLFDSCPYKPFINLDELYNKDKTEELLNATRLFWNSTFRQDRTEVWESFFRRAISSIRNQYYKLLRLHFTHFLNKLEYLSLTSFKDLVYLFWIRFKTMD